MYNSSCSLPEARNLMTSSVTCISIVTRTMEHTLSLVEVAKNMASTETPVLGPAIVRGPTVQPIPLLPRSSLVGSCLVQFIFFLPIVIAFLAKRSIYKVETLQSSVFLWENG